VTSYAQAGADWGKYRFDPSRDNASDTYPFPILDFYRTSDVTFESEYWWLGKMANGSQIQSGNYT
jgi:hypothetical protein